MEDFNYAILDEENLVIDIIVANEEFMVMYFTDKKYAICKEDTIIGMRYIQETNEFIDESYVEPEPLPEPIPQVITMRQARLKLLEVGLLDDVEALVAPDRKSQIEWEYANEVYRQSPLVELVKEAVSLTDEQIDDMFLEASKL